MKKFFGTLVLSLFLIMPSHSDDIRDFQIEGISIGDSLLDYMTIEEIKQNTLNYFQDERNYYVVAMIDNLNQYDQIELYLKSNDRKYEILNEFLIYLKTQINIF